MSLKDKLEVGLKPDAPYRPDNLPEFQQDDPACQIAGEPGDSADLRQAREDCDKPVVASPKRKTMPSRRKRTKIN